MHTSNSYTVIRLAVFFSRVMCNDWSAHDLDYGEFFVGNGEGYSDNFVRNLGGENI